MSLRSRSVTAFFVQCDTCGVETAGSQMPVEAEVRAAEGGWRAEKNPLRHVCPWCLEKRLPTSDAATQPQTETTTGL